jgi:hypothetical protein
MKTYATVEVQLHSFITSALDGGEWSASHRGRFTQDQNLQYSLKMWLGENQSRYGL